MGKMSSIWDLGIGIWDYDKPDCVPLRLSQIPNPKSQFPNLKFQQAWLLILRLISFRKPEVFL